MNKKIGVIGGGFTGLVAAYELSKQGHSVSIFDTSTQVGGLAAGFKLHGTSLEKAYHHIFSTDKDILALVEELGITSKVLWNPSSVAIYFEGRMHPFTGVFDVLKFQPLSILERIRLSAVLWYLQQKNDWRTLVKISAVEWLQKYCGKRIYDVVWEPLLRGKFHRHAINVSMAWLWARIHTRAHSRSHLLAKEKLGYFNGGFHTVVQRLVDDILNNGGILHTTTKVEAIGIDDEDRPQITIEGETHTFDVVIATCPSHAFARLAAKELENHNDYFAQLTGIRYLSALCVVFSSRQSLSRYYWHNMHDKDAPFLVFIQHTNFIDKAHYEGRHVYYIGTYLPQDHTYMGMDDETLRTLFFDYLKQMFEEFEESNVEEYYTFRLNNAQHVVDTEYERKISAYATPLPHVYLSNFSQIFPEDRGTNFSVREGKAVVEYIQKVEQF